MITEETDDRRCVSMSKIIEPDMANFSGNAHGGHLMQFLDYVAYVCATRYCRKNTVTASVTELSFRAPVHVGELFTAHAAVNHTGTSSMEIGIRAEAENLTTGEIRHVISCYFNFVALDENQKPCPVPVLEITTPIQQQRHQAAKLRRELRIEYGKRHDEIKKQTKDKLN